MIKILMMGAFLMIKVFWDRIHDQDLDDGTMIKILMTEL